MSTVTVEYFGVHGTGRTVAEAKRDAGAKIERSMTGSYYPRLLTLGKFTALLYRQPMHGWGYTFITANGEAREGLQTGHITGDDETVAACERSCRRHLGQLAIFELPDAAILDFVDRADRADTARYIQWQRCYREWAQMGANDNDCREHAGRDEWPTNMDRMYHAERPSALLLGDACDLLVRAWDDAVFPVPRV